MTSMPAMLMWTMAPKHLTPIYKLTSTQLCNSVPAPTRPSGKDRDAAHTELDLLETITLKSIHAILLDPSDDPSIPTHDDLIGTYPISFGFDELLADHNLIHDKQFDLDDISPNEELNHFFHVLQTNVTNISPEEHALGHWTLHPLQT
jgi:hypothetical protein